ncbi:MAG: hypothetical protein Kow00117_06910 [Phototrophicales bacterium]
MNEFYITMQAEMELQQRKRLQQEQNKNTLENELRRIVSEFRQENRKQKKS